MNAPKPPSAKAANIKRAADGQRAMLAALNDRIAQVLVGDKVRYVDLTKTELAFLSKADMADRLAHVEMLDKKGEPISAFKWWLRQADRNQLEGVVFEPDPSKAPKDKLNLHKGRAIDPAPDSSEADWALFKAHLWENVASKSRGNFTFALDWMAHLFQYPGAKIGVGMVLYGGVGVGKSIVSDILAHCLGVDYCPVVDSPEALTGNFNKLISRAQLIRVEEAFNPRDPRHDARLKNMLTGARTRVELKGVDAFEIDSKCNMVFTTNKAHSIQALANERRYFCLTVEDHGQQKNRAYFSAILKQMSEGGYAAFVNSMLNRKIRADFANPPMTALLSAQIAESLTGLDRWWLATLREGRLPFVRESDAPSNVEWPEPDTERSANPSAAWDVLKDTVYASAVGYCKSYDGPPTAAAVGKYLAANVDGLTRLRVGPQDARVHLYHLPPLAACRQSFVERHKGLRLEDVVEAVPEADETAAAAPAAQAAKTTTSSSNSAPVVDLATHRAAAPQRRRPL